MLYLIIYLVPTKRSQCLRGDQSRYILLCIIPIQGLWLCVLSFVCRRHRSAQRSDEDTRHNLLDRDRVDAWFEAIINVAERECTHCSVSLAAGRMSRSDLLLYLCSIVLLYIFGAVDMCMCTNGHCPQCSLMRDGATCSMRRDKL